MECFYEAGVGVLLASHIDGQDSGARVDVGQILRFGGLLWAMPRN